MFAYMACKSGFSLPKYRTWYLLEKTMKISCVSCGYEINLDHEVFENYEGPIKCFCCSNVMHIKAKRGTLNSVESSSVLPPHSTEDVVKRNLQNQGMWFLLTLSMKQELDHGEPETKRKRTDGRKQHNWEGPKIHQTSGALRSRRRRQ